MHSGDASTMSEGCSMINTIRPSGVSSDAMLLVLVWICAGALAIQHYNGSPIVALSSTPVVRTSLMSAGLPTYPPNSQGGPIIYCSLNYVAVEVQPSPSPVLYISPRTP
ncbi:uncharacterized protein EI90DRAFT_3030958 [Cantharellus anzutake]|uniref:uncharacterized protein n=1 Tax=Cantharellus anzutake TaxID=1750568 RepID=UPI0019048B93|nr:uncharacterized protein EI90DRAFT_3030958 [Cantharellus anzutake]KAF8342985.1 hypothetical protein EI90DRAFT_3030958 [Cantharellus anzutake]